MDAHKDLLVNLLGLEAAATDEAIMNAAKTFQSDMVTFKNTLEGQNATLQNAVVMAEKRATEAETAATALANEGKAMAEELVNADLERYKNVITNADEIKAQLISNRAATVAILKNIKAPTTSTRTAPIHNPGAVGTPPPVDGKLTNVATPEEAKKVSNRARELSNQLKVSYQTAFIMAKGEQAKASA